MNVTFPDEPSEIRIEVSSDNGDTIVQGARFKTPAENPDLRIGRVDVFNVLAMDLSELVTRPTEDRRILQRLRAEDTLFTAIKRSLIGDIEDCADDAESIRSRMDESLGLGGKAVWSDQFLDRFAPIRLPTPRTLEQNNRPVGLSQRLSNDPNSPLHFLRFQDQILKMFRDGTISYTVQTSFEDHVSTSHGGDWLPPATIAQAIVRLNALDELLVNNFRIALASLVRRRDFRDAVSNGVRAGKEKLQLILESELHNAVLKRRSKAHTAIFVERFFDGEKARGIRSVVGQAADNATVDLTKVVESSSLAGLLNTASWYRSYDHRYVQSLRRKEIGYRDDEIYLSDGNATVISAAGFWDEGSEGSKADPLSRYKLDLVLAIQYNVAYHAYCGSTLAYYQSHPDVGNLESGNPGVALPYVIDGRAILSHLDQALDLALLVEHGFTRVFIKRLREELGIDGAVASIRQRVQDGSTSVGLKSAVQAAEHTSIESLRAALENNRIQRTIRLWAVVAIAVAIILFCVGLLVQSLRSQPNEIVCVAHAEPAHLTCTTLRGGS